MFLKLFNEAAHEIHCESFWLWLGLTDPSHHIMAEELIMPMPNIQDVRILKRCPLKWEPINDCCDCVPKASITQLDRVLTKAYRRCYADPNEVGSHRTVFKKLVQCILSFCNNEAEENTIRRGDNYISDKFILVDKGICNGQEKIVHRNIGGLGSLDGDTFLSSHSSFHRENVLISLRVLSILIK
jgi:hypothetical protein